MASIMPPDATIPETEGHAGPPADGCAHAKVMPRYDHDAARGLSVATVRRQWPRFYGTCPDCGGSVILYASFAHYIAGDW